MHINQRILTIGVAPNVYFSYKGFQIQYIEIWGHQMNIVGNGAYSHKYEKIMIIDAFRYSCQYQPKSLSCEKKTESFFANERPSNISSL